MTTPRSSTIMGGGKYYKKISVLFILQALIFTPFILFAEETGATTTAATSTPATSTTQGISDRLESATDRALGTSRSLFGEIDLLRLKYSDMTATTSARIQRTIIEGSASTSPLRILGKSTLDVLLEGIFGLDALREPLLYLELLLLSIASLILFQPILFAVLLVIILLRLIFVVWATVFR